jgi:opacity protein-like surface antigen
MEPRVIQTRLGLLSSLLVALGVSGHASAADPLGLYVGAAVGQGEVTAHIVNPVDLFGDTRDASDTFSANHATFKVMVGLQPVKLLSAELSYIDFGSSNAALFGNPASASMRGESAFGMLHLPTPVIDMFVKAGIAHLQTGVNFFGPNGDNLCLPGTPCGTVALAQDRTNTTFAAGAGAQMAIGPWTVRAEYERFNTLGEGSRLLSLGLTWSF